VYVSIILSMVALFKWAMKVYWKGREKKAKGGRKRRTEEKEEASTTAKGLWAG
jgi:hypothetical protein